MIFGTIAGSLADKQYVIAALSVFPLYPAQLYSLHLLDSFLARNLPIVRRYTYFFILSRT
jgi:hypothetical protein